MRNITGWKNRVFIASYTVRSWRWADARADATISVAARPYVHQDMHIYAFLMCFYVCSNLTSNNITI